MELSFQVKLLTLLENKIVRRLGSVREHKADVRIIAATNKPLEQMVKEGKFRSDLYFRLRIVSLRVPPLRERGSDVTLLARHFLALHAARYRRPALHFTPDALDRLQAHRWPGNVRELRNVIEQCVVMARSDAIGATSLGLIAGFDENASHAASDGVAAGHKEQARDAMNLGQVERALLERALDECGWNITQAAKTLGVTRDTLRYRIEKYGFSRP